MLIYLIKDSKLLKLMYFITQAPHREFSKEALLEYTLEEDIEEQIKTLEECEFIVRGKNRRGDEIFKLNPFFPFKKEFKNILLNYRLYSKDENLGILCENLEAIECAVIFKDTLYLFLTRELKGREEQSMRDNWLNYREHKSFEDLPMYLLIGDRQTLRIFKEGHFLKKGTNTRNLFRAFNI